MTADRLVTAVRRWSGWVAGDDLVAGRAVGAPRRLRSGSHRTPAAQVGPANPFRTLTFDLFLLPEG